MREHVATHVANLERFDKPIDEIVVGAGIVACASSAVNDRYACTYTYK
jgi:hypothetical protein